MVALGPRCLRTIYDQSRHLPRRLGTSLTNLSPAPLRSSFVWRNELSDVFYEELGGPWFGGPFLGTPIFNARVRTLGVKIGKGVWLELYWLPETDLVHLGTARPSAVAACCRRTCSTVAFPRISAVHSVAARPSAAQLRAGASIGAGARMGPGSLVMGAVPTGPAGKPDHRSTARKGRSDEVKECTGAARASTRRRGGDNPGAHHS